MDASLVAAVCSAIATALAAFATWRGPIAAAKIADELRKDSQEIQERKRLKMNIFSVLMQERAAWYTIEAVRALNSIDIIFVDCRAVRDGWAEFYSTLETANNVPPHVQQEKFRYLLVEMAKDLGLANELRPADITRTYFPNALEQQRLVEDMERLAALERLRGKSPSANNASTATVVTPFPPRP